jgi:hypothetical protein
MVMMAADVDSATYVDRWKDLLVGLTAQRGDFLVMKHLDQALAERGDFDCSLSKQGFDAATDLVARAAKSWHADARVVTCNHVPDARLVFVVSAATFPYVEEIDFAASLSFRGIRYAKTSALGPHTVVIDGIRRLTPLAEGALLHALYGARPGWLIKPGDQELIRAAAENGQATFVETVQAIMGNRLGAYAADKNPPGEGASFPWWLMLRDLPHVLARIRSRVVRCSAMDLVQSSRNMRRFLRGEEYGSSGRDTAEVTRRLANEHPVIGWSG